MEVSSAVVANFVILSSLPVIVESAHPLVHLQVMQSGVGDQLLLDSGGVGLGVNSVLGKEGESFRAVVDAVLLRLGNFVHKVFDKADKRDEIAN